MLFLYILSAGSGGVGDDCTGTGGASQLTGKYLTDYFHHSCVS